MFKTKSLLFPFEHVARGSRVILYGAGDVGQTFYWQIKRGGYCEIVGWIDKSWFCSSNLKYPKMCLSDLSAVEYDNVVIAVSDEYVAAAIIKELKNAGVSENKIIWCDNYLINFQMKQYGKIADQTDATIAESLQVRDNVRNIRIGMLAAGNFAETIARMLNNRTTGGVLYAVAARDIERAKKFAERHNIPNAYGSYAELVGDSNVDLVYISSPPAFHYEHVKLCLEHGKNVLCEKPFVMNESEAVELIELARKKNLFLTDGLWTVYLPMAYKIKEVVRSGVIGEISSIVANQHYYGSGGSLERGDGAFLTMGVYHIAFVEMILGKDIKNIRASALFSEKGVDKQTSVILEYENAMATLNCGFDAVSDRCGGIFGDKGYIFVEDAHEYKHIIIYDTESMIIAEYTLESGYQYEFIAAIDAILQGKIETGLRSHAEIIFLVKICDEVMRQISSF